MRYFPLVTNCDKIHPTLMPFRIWTIICSVDVLLDVLRNLKSKIAQFFIYSNFRTLYTLTTGTKENVLYFVVLRRSADRIIKRMLLLIDFPHFPLIQNKIL